MGVSMVLGSCGRWQGEDACVTRGGTVGLCIMHACVTYEG